MADTINVTSLDILTRKILNYAADILYLFHMPLFFALSGALFKNSRNKGKFQKFKDLVINKSKRLLIPFMIVTLLFFIPIKYLSGYFNSSSNILKDIFVGQILLQGNSHLWFFANIVFRIFNHMTIEEKINSKHKTTIFLLFFILLNIASALIDIIVVKNVFYYLIYFYIGYLFED